MQKSTLTAFATYPDADDMGDGSKRVKLTTAARNNRNRITVLTLNTNWDASTFNPCIAGTGW